MAGPYCTLSIMGLIIYLGVSFKWAKTIPIENHVFIKPGAKKMLYISRLFTVQNENVHNFIIIVLFV